MAYFSNTHQEHVISLQIGHETNNILSYLWSAREMDLIDEEGKIVAESSYHIVNDRDQLVPKVVMVDNQNNELESNDSTVDINKIQKSVPWEGPSMTINRASATARQTRKSTYRPYYLKTRYHHKSFVPFDPVDEKENSHWYYQRKANNGIRETTEDSEEIVLDSIRYFAEASDRVDSIDVFADLYGDLGYTTSRLIEQLRDDYSKSISIPVFLLDHCHMYDYHHLLEQQHHHRLAPVKTSNLFDNSLILNYSNLIESSDLIVPIRIPVESSIEDLNARFFHYRLTGAVALEATLAFRQMHRDGNCGDLSHLSTKEWIQMTTNYRLPITSMEAFIPALTHDVELTQDYLFETLDHLKKDATYHLHQYQYNPFMKSFALPSMLKSAVASYDTYKRPLTNTLAFRGYGGPEFTEKLFVECIQSSYLITKCNSFSSCLPVKWQESALSEASGDVFVAGTAIGSNASIGDHLREETTQWYESALGSITQYAKIDLAKEDLENKRELLLQLSESYM